MQRDHESGETEPALPMFASGKPNKRFMGATLKHPALRGAPNRDLCRLGGSHLRDALAMSPMLRGEALPLPAKEMASLRADLDREYGDSVVPTTSGPLYIIRVPHGEPDFLRDLEAAVDVLPYRDLRGYRAVLLIGDRAHMGVSIDMLRSLLEARERSQSDWLQRLRGQLAVGDFHLGRVPTDPQRRLRAVFHVEVDSVTQLEEADFNRLAEMLPDVKAAAPGQVRPAFAYLLARDDHVQLDGGPFFTDLERRRRRREERQAHREVSELEERHDLAVAHLDRVLKQRGETMPRSASRGAPRFESRPAAGHASSPARTRHDRAAPTRPAAISPPLGSTPERDSLRTPPAPPAPIEPARPDPFAAMVRHTEPARMLRGALDAAGYKTKERLMVRDAPIAFAAARPDGYPGRVLATFVDHLDAAYAQRLLLVGRSVGAELVLVVADRVDPAAEKTVLATNLKILDPEAVAAVRFG